MHDLPWKLVAISSTGALIELDGWLEVEIGDTLELQIYSHGQDKQVQVSPADQRCVVKKLAREDRHVAVMFTST
jgi:hypothetical protein